jgi:hypothetical protein
VQVSSFAMLHPACDIRANSEKSTAVELSRAIDSGWDVISLNDGKPCGDQIKLITGAKNVRSLLGGSCLRDADFETIASLPDLEELWLRTDLTRRAVRAIAGLKKLRRLDLICCRLNDNAAAELQRLNLTWLNLNHVEVAPAGWESIGRLSELTSLELFEAQITDADLRHLGGLTQLKSVQISQAPLTDAGVAALAPLAEIQKLTVSWTGLTDAGLRRLAETHPGLLELDISHTKVTSAGLACVPLLKHLDALTIDGRLLDADGIASLKRCGALCRLTVDTLDSPQLLGFDDVQAALHALQDEIPQLELAEYQ